MTFYVENETEVVLPFPVTEAVENVIKEALSYEKCPYEVEINVLFTDNEGIRELNKEYREIDKETDVLSFPNVDYEIPSDFSIVEEDKVNYFNPDTEELILGDIIISLDKVFEQAEQYGHSVLREFSFLIAHSMLHLFGYDHMEPEEAKVMEDKQEAILKNLSIGRE